MTAGARIAVVGAFLLVMVVPARAQTEAGSSSGREGGQNLADVKSMTMEELLEEFHHPPYRMPRPLPQRRIDVINALRKLGDPLLLKLKADLASPDPEVVKAAERVLGNLGNAARDAVPELVAALGHEDDEVRAWAVPALSHLKDPRAFYPLVEATRDPSSRVRAAVLRSASGCLADGCFATAAVALGDENKSVRKAAIDQLKMLKDKRAVPLLVPLLEDAEVHHYNVREGIKTANRNCDEVVLALEYIVNGRYIGVSRTTQEENDQKVQQWRQRWKENGDEFVRQLYAEPELRRSTR
jgi:HEAT repeat protein